MSNITIVLNKEAVDALFPEGSEARLQLAHSAIQSVVKNVVKPTQISAELLAIVERHVEQAKQEVLKGFRGRRGPRRVRPTQLEGRAAGVARQSGAPGVLGAARRAGPLRGGGCGAAGRRRDPVGQEKELT